LSNLEDEIDEPSTNAEEGPVLAPPATPAEELSAISQANTNEISDAVVASTPCMAADKPVLIELFTSEGCSSCPAADEYLSTLRHGNKNIILIGEHVDYWNNLGWADPFSSSKSTERQRRYCQKLGANPYTPQAVINGARECVASNKSAVQDAISSFSSSNALAVPITIKICRKRP